MSTGIRCFNMGWAVLLDGQIWIKWAGILSNVATVIAACVAIVAAIIALLQYRSSIRESRRAAANQIYQQYLNVCFHYPNFSMGMLPPKTKSDDYTKYCWFVSAMLFSFEEILDVCPTDEKWQLAIESQLRRHVEHLKKSSTVKQGQWSKPLQVIINKVVC